MKVKTLLAAIIASGNLDFIHRVKPTDAAETANKIAEEIMKQNDEEIDEPLTVFIVGESG